MPARRHNDGVSQGFQGLGPDSLNKLPPNAYRGDIVAPAQVPLK